MLRLSLRLTEPFEQHDAADLRIRYTTHMLLAHYNTLLHEVGDPHPLGCDSESEFGATFRTTLRAAIRDFPMGVFEAPVPDAAHLMLYVQLTAMKKRLAETPNRAEREDYLWTSMYVDCHIEVDRVPVAIRFRDTRRRTLGTIRLPI